MLLDKKIISNSVWMMLEKFLGIFGLIFVTSYVAKYIGPTNFGKIALVTTIFTFIQSFVWFGNQEILFKRVSKNAFSGLKYLFATQKIRILIFSFLSIPLLFILYIFSDFLTFIYGIATAIATLFLIQDIFIIYNNATLNSYVNALSNMIGLLAALFFRYVVVFYELNYSFLAIPIVSVTLIPYLLKILFFNRLDKMKINKTKKYVSYYFLAGSGLLMSSLSIVFYTQITSFILASLESTHALGIYSAALPLGMSWVFINLAIITSVLSKVYREKDAFTSYKLVSQLNLIIVLISLTIALGLYFSGEWLIVWLYGYDFKAANELLIILCFATMFSSLGTISARLLIKEESYHYISKKMLVVAVFSLPIAWGFIHFLGLKGAAYSILFIELISATLFNYFYKNGLIFKIHFFPFYQHKLRMLNNTQKSFDNV